MNSYEWWREIFNKYPPFNVTIWKPLSERFPEKTVKELWREIGK